MAKNKMDEFDDFDDNLDFPGLDDNDFDFGGSDVTDIDSDSDRSPASKSQNLFRKGMSGVKTVGVGVAKAVKNVVTTQFPTTTGILSDTAAGLGSFKSELSEVGKDVAPALQEFKQFKRKVTPRIKAALGIKASVDDYSEDSGSSEPTVDPQAEMDAKIKGEVSAIFKANRRRSTSVAKKKEVDDQIDRLVSTKRYSGQMMMLQDMKSISLLQHGFNKDILTPFLKKSLELKYRHLYVAQETLTLQRALASTLENKLEQIRHNTALPNEAKVQMMEVLGDTMKRSFTNKINNSVQETIQGIFQHNIQENIKPITEMAGLPMMGLSMWLEGMEMEEEMAEMTGARPKSIAQSGAEMAIGGILGKKFSKHMDKLKGVSGEFISRVSGGRLKGRELIDSADSLSEIAPGQLSLLIENLKDGRLSDLTEDADLSERLAKLETILEPLLPEGKGASIAIKDERLSDVAKFDYSVKRSIIETIPGFLSKILSQVTQFNTKQPAEDLVYDFKRRGFLSSSAVSENLITDVYGSFDARKRVLTDTTNTIHHNLKTDEEKATLDSLADDMATFTSNSIRARYFPIIRAADIYNAASSGDFDYNNYITTVLRGVSNPKALLEFISSYIFYENGTLNYPNYTSLVKSITGGAEYLERAKDSLVEKLKESTAGSQILSKIVNTEKLLKSGVYEVDDDKLSEILDEGYVFGDEHATMSDEDLLAIMGKKEFDKYKLNKKKRAMAGFVKHGGAGTTKDLVTAATKVKNDLTGNDGLTPFATTEELFHHTTYEDKGLSAGADYIASLIDPNSKTGLIISATNSFVSKLIHSGRDQYAKMKKTTLESDIVTTASKINAIVKRVPEKGVIVLYEIDDIYKTDPEATEAVIDSTLKALESNKNHPSVKPIVDVLVMLETKYKESTLSKLANSETRSETATKLQEDVKKSFNESNAGKLLNTGAKSTTDKVLNKLAEIAKEHGVDSDAVNIDTDNVNLPVIKPGNIFTGPEMPKEFSENKTFLESIFDRSKNLKNKASTMMESINSKQEDKTGSIAPTNVDQKATDQYHKVVAPKITPTKEDKTESTARPESTEKVSWWQQGKDRIKSKIGDRFTKKDADEASESIFDSIKNKVTTYLNTTDVKDTGTMSFSTEATEVLNKQVEILEIISTDTKEMVKELSTLKEGIAYISSVASGGDPKSKGILGKIFSGTAMAGSGLFSLTMATGSLLGKGMLGGVTLAGKALGFGIALPFKGMKAVLQGMFGSRDKSMTDVYVVGENKKLELLVDQHTLARHGVFESGVKVTSVFKITEPVYHNETKDVIISDEHIKRGLYDKEGNELLDKKSKMAFLKKILKPVGVLAALPFKLTGLWFKGLGGLAGLAYSGVAALFNKRNPYVDVYLKGEVQPGKQLLYGEAIKRGEYCYLNGAVLKSAYEIDSAIYTRDGKNIGNCIITEEQIKRGLVDINGKSLASKYGKSIARRVTGALAGAAGAVIGAGYKLAKFATKSVYELAKLPFKGIGAIGNRLFGKRKPGSIEFDENIRPEHLKSLVGDKLDSVISLLKRGFNLDVEDDISGDGLRDNSYEAWKRKKEESNAVRAQKRAERDEARRAKIAALAAGGSKFGPKEEEGGFFGSMGDWLTGGASAAGGLAFLRGTKLGKWAGSTKLGGWLGKKIFGSADDAAKLATTTSKTGKAAGFIAKYGKKAFDMLPNKAKAVLLAGGAAAVGMGMMGDDADAASLVDPEMSTSEPKSPYTQSEQSASTVGTGTREATRYDQKFLEARAVGYGFGQDFRQISSIISTIEQSAYDAYTENVPVADDTILSIASNFVSIDESNRDSVLKYFKEWWDGRVLPVYYTFLNTLKAFNIDITRRDFFGAETDDKTQKLAYETFISNVNKLRKDNTIQKLVPNQSGYDTWVLSSQYTPSKDLSKTAEAVKSGEVDKATESMSMWGKFKATVGASALGGLGYAMLPGAGKETVKGAIGSAWSGAKSLVKGIKMPGLGVAIDAGLTGKDAYDAYKEDDTDSMIQSIVRGAGSIIGGVAGGAVAGGTTLGVGTAAGYIGGSMAGEMLAGKLAGRLSAWFSSESGPGIFGKPANEWMLFKARADMYGVKNYEEVERIIEYLEKDTLKEKLIDDNRMYRYAERFGYDPKTDTVDKIKHFKLWYTQRFYPICISFLKLLEAMGISYSDLSGISKRHAITLIENLARASNNTVKKFDALQPNLDSYKKWRELTIKDMSDLDSTLDYKDVHEMKVRQETTNTATSKHTDATDKERTAALAMSVPEAKVVSSDIPVPTSSSTPTAGGTVVAATVGVATDTGSTYTPGTMQADVNLLDNQVGSVSAGFESGGKGSMAIGYDRTGGTSYGKYQFAAKTGALAEFIEWLLTNGGEKFANRMIQAVGYAPNSSNRKGWGDTGGKTGIPVEAWKAGVAAGELGALESAFFRGKLSKLTARLAKGLTFRGTTYPGDPNLANMVQDNPGLLEMANSTIVQHGDSGGAAILMKAKDADPINYVNKVYKVRSTQFGSSTPAVRASVLRRFDKERPTIIEMVKQYLAGKPKDESEATDTDTAVNVPDTSATGGSSGMDMSVGLASQVHTTTSMPSQSVAGGGDASISVTGSEPSPNMGAAGASGTVAIDTGGVKDGSLDDVRVADKGVDIQNLHPRLRKALAGLNADFKETFGEYITVNSGYRSRAKQQALYDQYGPGRAAKPNPKAPHMFEINGKPSAIAFDANSTQMHKADGAGLLAKYGLSRPLWPHGKGKVKPEPWHVQLSDTTPMTTAEDLMEPKPTEDVDTTLASTTKEASEAYAATVATDPVAQENVSQAVASSSDASSPNTTVSDPIAEAINTTIPATTSVSSPVDTASGSHLVKEAGTSTSNMESIAMMQLEQLRIMVSSLNSISDNTKTLPSLDFAALEQPIMSLADRISEALASITDSGEDTKGSNTRKIKSNDDSKPSFSRRPVSSNRVTPGQGAINVSSRHYNL